MADSDLLAALVKQAKGFQDRVPVFYTVRPTMSESMAQARRITIDLWPQFGDCSPWPELDNPPVSIASMQLPDDGRVDVFHSSGAIAGVMRPRATRRPIAPDETKADRKGFSEFAHKIATEITKSYIGPNDELRFESRWELKGQTVTLKGEKGPVALFEVLCAFRRYLQGLPVLGRASVHISVGSGQQVTRWGIDWRRVRPAPFTHTSVISPEEGAKRVLDDLWWRRPERPFTLKDFEPKTFMLGYLSQSRRREQYVMQPAWVAILGPRTEMSMGHVVAVPAAPREFESIARPAKVVGVSRS